MSLYGLNSCWSRQCHNGQELRIASLYLLAFWLVFAPLYCSGSVNRYGVNRAANCRDLPNAKGLGRQVPESQVNQLPCPVSASLVDGKACGALPKFVIPFSSSRGCTEIGLIHNLSFATIDFIGQVRAGFDRHTKGHFTVPDFFVSEPRAPGTYEPFFIQTDDDSRREVIVRQQCCNLRIPDFQLLIDLVHQRFIPRSNKFRTEILECNLSLQESAEDLVRSCKSGKIDLPIGFVGSESGGSDYQLVANCGDLAYIVRATVPIVSQTVGSNRNWSILKTDDKKDGSAFRLGPCHNIDDANAKQKFYLQLSSCETSISRVFPEQHTAFIDSCGLSISAEGEQWYAIAISSRKEGRP